MKYCDFNLKGVNKNGRHGNANLCFTLDFPVLDTCNVNTKIKKEKRLWT